MSKDNFNIIFFELDNDACPVQSFLDSLDDKMAAKMIELAKKYRKIFLERSKCQ